MDPDSGRAEDGELSLTLDRQWREPPQVTDGAGRGGWMKAGFLAFSVMVALLAAPAPAQIFGPDAARCAAGNSPAILVMVVGLKNRGGSLRVRTFGGATSTWFDKKGWQTRVELQTPPAGPIRVCMPVAAPGDYAIDLRHDVNGNGDTDRSDGGGGSGDPHVTLLDFIFGRKPSPKVTAVRVGQGVTEITVTAMYLSRGALRPVRQIADR
jgi:uncharacterized protein (DUF2141 family)